MILPAAERWAAVRALFQGASPTPDLLAAATGFSARTISRRAGEEGWSAADAGQETSSAVRMRRLLNWAITSLEAVRLPDGAEGWKIERDRVELVSVMARTAEKIDELLTRLNADRDAIEQDDNDIRDGLAHLNQRIIELAREHARELGLVADTAPDPAAPGRMDRNGSPEAVSASRRAR